MSVDSRRAEEMLRRLADDGVEIVDLGGLVGKSAGVGDIGPGRSVLPHGQDLFYACDPCKQFWTRPEHCPKAARQMPLADVQLRRQPSYAQRGIASQTWRSTARDRVRPALAQVSKQKTLDPREPRGAVRSLHQHFFQQGQVARLEKMTQVDLFIYEVLHPLAHQPSGGLRLGAGEENGGRAARTYSA